MQQSNRNFQSQNLTVDYITLNLRNGKSQILEIAKIFNFLYSFDCYIFNHDQKYSKKREILVNNQPYKLIFAINSSEHKANTVLIQFAKLNAGYLYEILKNGQFSWQSFDHFDLVLGRIDINYIRKKKIMDDLMFLDFAERSSHKYKKRYPQAIIEPVLKSGFGLGTRKGDYFLRIYRTEDNFLKFELEIKKGKAKHFQSYFLQLTQTFVEFEDLVARRFYQYLKVALVLDTECTDWLVIILRQTNKPLNHLVSNYISTTLKLEEISPLQQKYFYRLLQFLSFSRSYSHVEETLNGQAYKSLTFPLAEFAKNIGFDEKTYTHYQRRQLVYFFSELHRFALIDWFSGEEFQSVLGFPVVKITHQQPGNVHTKLIIKISVAKDFFSSWKYPFYFPKHFYRYTNNDDMRVKLEILKSVTSQPTIRKEFDVANLLLTLTSISNQRKSNIKKNIIQLFQSLQQTSFIETELRLYQENKSCIVTERLTLPQINKTQTIVFYETNKSFTEDNKF